METRFVSEDFVVPLQVEQANYRLRPLTVTDVEHDYEAVMSSKESLRRIFCGDNTTWPADSMTLQDNYRDLERHQKDFTQRQGFTYTMETLDAQCCLGCVYIYPSQNGSYDAQVYYWVRDSVKAQGVEDELGAFLHQWLQVAWPFQHPAFPGREISCQEWQALKKSTAVS